MLYSDFQGMKLSSLGYGGMRLPVSQTNNSINEEETDKLFKYAYENGVNFFDTAFFYHGGKSEQIMGKLLKQFPRDCWYFSDKMPGNFIEYKNGKLDMDLAGMGMGQMSFNTTREIFEYQLKNCGVEYFDFYMLHNLNEVTFNLYTDDNLGMVDYLLEEKKAGRIRHIGFSTHGRPETIEAFIKKYTCFEFVLMQLNYLDWTLQEAGKKYDILTENNIPIFVMEPVRGGKLAVPGPETEAVLRAARPDDSPAKWAFRFLQSLPNVYMVVSGMSAMDQLKENIEIMSSNQPLTDDERDVLKKAVDTLGNFVPCTSCRYCCDSCPQKLDIPKLITAYNEASAGFAWWYISDLMDSLTDNEKPKACISCNACSSHCPQNIDIAGIMEKFNTLLKSKES